MAGGRRERKKRETLATLHRLALEMFAERGFQATTVDEIAEAADVSTRSFFRYFPTKLDVLLADHPARLLGVREVLRGRSSSEPVLDSVGAALRFLRDDARDQRETLVVQSRVARDEPQVLAGLLAHHVEVQWTLHAFVRARTVGDRYGVRAHVLSDVPFGVFCDALGDWLTAGAAGPFDPPIEEVLDSLR